MRNVSFADIEEVVADDDDGDVYGGDDDDDDATFPALMLECSE